MKAAGAFRWTVAAAVLAAMLDDLHEQAAAFIAQDPDQHRPAAVQSVMR